MSRSGWTARPSAIDRWAASVPRRTPRSRPVFSSAHLLTLEEARYIAVEKTFGARRPKTFVAANATGRRAFAAHAAALQSIPGGR